MSTDVTWQIECTSLEQTLKLAERIGKRLRGQEVIELVSDLGGGKTTFVKGLAKGIGSDDNVTSPTFTLTNVYKGPKLSLYHFDFYRLQEPGIMREELAEVVNDQQAVAVIEWADIVSDVLPTTRLTLQLSVTGESGRLIKAHVHPDLMYLVKDLA